MNVAWLKRGNIDNTNNRLANFSSTIRRMCMATTSDEDEKKNYLVFVSLSLTSHSHLLHSHTQSLSLSLSLFSFSLFLFSAFFTLAVFHCSFHSTGKYFTNYHSIKMFDLTFFRHRFIRYVLFHAARIRNE